MGSIEKLISFVIGLALTLAAAGQLPRATLWLIRHMPDQGPQPISLGRLNRALLGNNHSLGNHPKNHSVQRLIVLNIHAKSSPEIGDSL
jgi:hypothetical protein